MNNSIKSSIETFREKVHVSFNIETQIYSCDNLKSYPNLKMIVRHSLANDTTVQIMVRIKQQNNFQAEFQLVLKFLYILWL